MCRLCLETCVAYVLNQHTVSPTCTFEVREWTSLAARSLPRPALLLVAERVRDGRTSRESGGDADRRGCHDNKPEYYQRQPTPGGDHSLFAATAGNVVDGDVERDAERH
jgi:hypothetical protein